MFGAIAIPVMLERLDAVIALTVLFSVMAHGLTAEPLAGRYVGAASGRWEKDPLGL